MNIAKIIIELLFSKDILDILFSVATITIGAFGVYLSLVAAVTGCIVVIDIFVKNYSRDKDYKEYQELVKNPFDMSFLIPSINNHKVSYHYQDTGEDLVENIIVKRRIQEYIFIKIVPKISFELNHRYFGFECSESKVKPLIRFDSRFIVEKGPIKESAYYIDWHGFYHLTEPTMWFKDECYVPSFWINTKDSGEFTFVAKFQIICDGYKEIKERKHNIITRELKIEVID